MLIIRVEAALAILKAEGNFLLITQIVEMDER
jgi:hypothetical protein